MKLKKLLVVCSAAMILCGTSQAKVLKVGLDGSQAYTSIQAAVDDATDGDVIKVFQGTYMEQVEIRGIDNLAVDGQGAVVSAPTSDDIAGGAEMITGPLVKIVDCEEIRFTGMIIDGQDGVGVNPGAGTGDADTRFYGLFMLNSSGQIVDNAVINISWHNGAQQGIGAYVYVTDGIERIVNIRENIITNFNKGGLSVRGPLQSKIHKNTITHWGETGITAGNGLQVDGGTASITNNVISGSRYYDDDHQFWFSAAMLLIGWVESADNFRVVHNSVSNSDVGICVVDFGAGVTNFKVNNNTFEDCVWPVDVDELDDVKVHASKYLD